MARIYTPQTITILDEVQKSPGIPLGELRKKHPVLPYKELYNIAFRLAEQELVKKEKINDDICLTITGEGAKILRRLRPERDGMWKLVIFDIPEKQKYVRVVLRAKLKALGFKKWQNSIWISPFALDEEIENELGELAKKFFVRLIKTNSINRVEDLEKMFT